MKRTWKGWTLVDSTGALVLTGVHDPEPFTFARKRDAEAAKCVDSIKVVRCELILTRKVKK